MAHSFATFKQFLSPTTNSGSDEREPLPGRSSINVDQNRGEMCRHTDEETSSTEFVEAGTRLTGERSTSSMPARIGLLGAGGQARETRSYLPAGTETFWAVSAEYLHGNRIDQIDISVPADRDLDSWVVGAVGAPALRRDLVAAWPGDRFATIISPAAYIGPSCTIGPGTVIAPGAVLSVDVAVGEHCLVNIGATLSHDVELASFVTVGPGAHVAGRVRLGDGVFVGIGASISNDVNIASGVVIGAGATVLRDVTTPNAVVAGLPAKIIGVRDGWLDAV
jgi:sugar O-acyltransferase (sialic acid O-acetyltransferase NeuD family)